MRPPLGDSSRGARVKAASEWGAPYPEPPRHGLCGPPQPHSPPDTHPCPPRGDGACPLGPGGAPTIRGGHRRR